MRLRDITQQVEVLAILGEEHARLHRKSNQYITAMILTTILAAVAIYLKFVMGWQMITVMPFSAVLAYALILQRQVSGKMLEIYFRSAELAETLGSATHLRKNNRSTRYNLVRREVRKPQRYLGWAEVSDADAYWFRRLMSLQGFTIEVVR